jgi:hypothetical protein
MASKKKAKFELAQIIKALACPTLKMKEPRQHGNRGSVKPWRKIRITVTGSFS